MAHKISWKILLRHDTWVFYFLPLFLSLAIFIWIVYPRFQALRWHKKVIQEKKERILAYQKKIKSLQKELEKPKFDTQNLERRIFSGKDPYAIVAYIQEKIEKIPEVSVRSFRITQKTKETDFLEKVIITFILQTDIKGLTEILWQLQNEEKTLKIKRLSVYMRKNRQEEILNATLEIESLFWIRSA